MNRPAFSTGNTKSMEDKLKAAKDSESVTNDKDEGIKASDKVDALILSKKQAMEEHNLEEKTKGVRAKLKITDHNRLEILAQMNNRTIEQQAAILILEGLKRKENATLIQKYIDQLKNI